MNNTNKRDGFKSRFGIIAAAAGSAIGLGNVWRFPYMTGKHGGAAFLAVYIICILLVGLPVMLSELLIGRKAQKNVVEAFDEIKPKSKWYLSGIIGMSASFIIMTSYCVIAGWTLKYITISARMGFAGLSVEQIDDMFNKFTSNVYEPAIFALIIMTIAGFIVSRGVNKGIEAASKIIMPLLVVMLFVLVIRSITLPGASEGIKFLLQPDWSQLDSSTILAALGHSFFSLSLGQGIMVTYGSYINKKENLFSLAVGISAADTIIAVLAGLAIFPAVFALGLSPDSGPSLIFITLPNLFNQIPGGALFAFLFFVFLSFAALSSIISNVEVVVAYLVEKKKIARNIAAYAVTSGITAIGFLSALSMGPWKTQFFGRNFMDFMDWFAASFLLPLVGILFVAFVAWVLNNKGVAEELNLKDSSFSKFIINVFMVLVKYVIPVIIILIFLNGLGVI